MTDILEILIKLKTEGSQQVKGIIKDLGKLEGKTKTAGSSAAYFAKSLKQVQSSAITVKGNIRDLSANIDKLKAAQTKAALGFKKWGIAVSELKAKTQELKSPLQEIISLAKRAAIAFGGLTLGYKITDTLVNLERLQVLLQGVEGDSQKAARAFEFIRQTAANSPFSIDALADAFIKMRTAGIDPLNGSFQALVDAIAHFGGTNEDLKLAAVAIQQMAAKGVVSMEELRQQLGERVPSAILIMAEKLGYTKDNLQDFFKAVSDGAITADVALKALLQGFAEKYGGEAARQAQTLGGLFNKLANEWQNFILRLQDLGLLDTLKQILLDLINVLHNAIQSKLFEGLAKGLIDFLEAARKLFGILTDLIRTALKPFNNEIGALLIQTATFATGIILLSRAFITLKNAINAAKIAMAEFQLISFAGGAGKAGGLFRLSSIIALLTTSLGQLAKAGAMAKAGIVGLIAGVGYAAYQIGDWLQQNFLIVRKFGFQIVNFFGHIYYGLKILKEKVKSMFTGDETGLNQAKKDLEQFRKDLEETIKLDEQQFYKEKQKKEAVQETVQEKEKELQTNYNLLQQQQEAARLEAEKAQIVQQLAQLRQAAAQQYRQSLQAEKQLIAEIARIEQQRQFDLLSIENQIFNLKISHLKTEEQERQKLARAQEFEQKAREALAKGEIELAKRYLLEARSYFADIARAKDKAFSAEGLEGLERIKDVLGDIYDYQKQKAEEALELQRQKTEEIKKVFADISEQLNRLTDKTYSINVESPGLDEIIDKYNQLKDKVITITIQKVETTTEAHQTGGLVGWQKFARGGKLPGYGGGDKVKALLERGEFVIRKEAVKKYGAGLLYAINNMKIPLSRFKSGAEAVKSTGGALRKFIININGIELEGYAAEEILRKFEKENRRRGLLL